MGAHVGRFEHENNLDPMTIKESPGFTKASTYACLAPGVGDVLPDLVDHRAGFPRVMLRIREPRPWHRDEASSHKAESLVLQRQTAYRLSRSRTKGIHYCPGGGPNRRLL